MDLEPLTYAGPPVDDPEVLNRVPRELQEMLRRHNGWIGHGGGFHLRGACREPAWHSLREAWWGERALWRLFPAVGAVDVPFAEDFLGDQYLLREGQVLRLDAEIGSLGTLPYDLGSLVAAIERDPVATLRLEPLLEFRRLGGVLAPGQLLSVYPPFCTEESARGVSLRAIAAADLISSLADLARQLAAVPDGGRVRIVVEKVPDGGD
jgi:hypothetical protein